MTRHLVRALLVAAFSSMVASCAIQSGTVVLLPEKDGKDTALTVTQRGTKVTLAEPYSGTKLTNEGPKAYRSSQEEVQAEFGEALAARPVGPVQFTLYFVEGKDELTDESKQVVDTVFVEIAKRPVPDVLVIGHTDAVGTDQVNDKLSRDRADVIRAGLIQSGIAPENIVAIGRGKRELFVPTADGAAHPRNRRVEIVVR
jgi:outer membrane protein OmpA-like peptidoglycan-associated protein